MTHSAGWLKGNKIIWDDVESNKKSHSLCLWLSLHSRVNFTFFCFIMPKRGRRNGNLKNKRKASGTCFSEKLQHNNFPLAVVFRFLICFELVILCAAAPLAAVFVTCLSLRLARLQNLLSVRFLYPHPIYQFVFPMICNLDHEYKNS